MNCRDDKAALMLLSMLFQKKSAQDPLLYIYEEHEVKEIKLFSCDYY